MQVLHELRWVEEEQVFLVEYTSEQLPNWKIRCKDTESTGTLLWKSCLILADFLHTARFDSILELGCGLSFPSMVFLNQNPFAKATAVDSDPESVKLAQSNATLNSKAFDIKRLSFLCTDWSSEQVVELACRVQVICASDVLVDSLSIDSFLDFLSRVSSRTSHASGFKVILSMEKRFNVLLGDVIPRAHVYEDWKSQLESLQKTSPSFLESFEELSCPQVFEYSRHRDLILFQLNCRFLK